MLITRSVALLLCALGASAWSPPAADPARGTVPLSRFVQPGASPDDVRRGLEQASLYSARNQVAVSVDRGVFTIGGTVRLAGGTQFVGGGGELRRGRDARGAYLFKLTGSNILIDGLRINMNGAGEYAAGFAIREGGLRRLTFRNVTFFDTREPDPRQNFGDRWAILIAPVEGPRLPVEDLVVERCRATDGIQLTAGYGSRGVRGVSITGNYVSDPEENGIALVLAGGSGGIENVVIADNVIRRVRGVGIYVGVDRDSQAGTFVRNVRVERNRVEGFANTRRGGFGILFRAAELGNEQIIIRDNQVDGSGARNTVGLRLSAKRQSNPNLRPGQVRFFDAPLIVGNTFDSVSPGIDLWATRGGRVVGNRGSVPRMTVLRGGSSGVSVSARGGR